MPHLNFNDFLYYVQVIDHGGFAQAGRYLSMPKSKLSRHIAALEERLGVRLILRNSRNFAATEIGKAYYVHCKAMLDEANAAQELIDSIHGNPYRILSGISRMINHYLMERKSGPAFSLPECRQAVLYL